MKILLIFVLLVGLSTVSCQDQTPTPTFLDLVGTIFNSIAINISKIFVSNREEFKEFEDCGKRRKIIPEKEFLFNDCLWDCKWKHNPFYKHGRELFFEDFYNQTTNIISLITTPRVPEDLSCLSDCFTGAPVFDVCSKCCLPATCESSECCDWYPADTPRDCFFKCFRERRQVNGRFFARTFYDMAVEFCRLSLLKKAVEMNLFPKGDCSTINIEILQHNPFRGKPGKSSAAHRIVEGTQTFDNIVSSDDNTRLFGASVYPVDAIPDTRFHPWLCSLRTRGFRGRHRCGVTLLSGPTEDAKHATVLVGTAHCNYICKERDSGNIYETCCCRPESNPASCKKSSSYCRGDPIFTLAEADDLQIVCGEFNVESPESELSSAEMETVLDILKIINHPEYKPNKEPGVGGPIEGNDISVYIVDDSQFKMVKGVTWPVCLPKEDYDPENLGIIVGWQDSEPTYLIGGSFSISEYRFLNFYPRQLQVEEIICRDPAWMNTNTFYPHGTVCYRDPSLASCPEFGVSGSGVVRKWRRDPKDKEDQYSLVGPLTISKGCDLAYYLPNFMYRGENAAVVTDATCYIDWVADQYQLTLPQEYKKKASCFQGKGDRRDFNKNVCKTSFGTYCNFSAVDFKGELWDSCRLLTREGLAYNINRCIENGNTEKRIRYGNCANNCKGVDPNAIIGAGVAAATAAGIGAVGLIGPVLGIGGIGAVGAAGGALMTRMGTCRSPLCRVGNRCCRLIFNNGRTQCPSRC